MDAFSSTVESRTRRARTWQQSRAICPGPRSLQGLEWLSRVEVARPQDLMVAFGWGRSANISHIARLIGAGLVERHRFDGPVLTITAAGRDRTGDPIGGSSGRLAYGTQCRHMLSLASVAAIFHRDGRDWVSERELRGDASWRVPVIDGRGGTHRPDLGILTPGGRLAVEVELTAKAPSRLRSILTGYREAILDGALAGVLYVVQDPSVARLVRRTRKTVGLTDRGFRLRTIDQLTAAAKLTGAERAA